MMSFAAGVVLLLLAVGAGGREMSENVDNLESKVSKFFQGGGSSEEMIDEDGNAVGKKWAVLIAGSQGYVNYRHQADVCHAYQVLKKGGLEDENIIVFMYDDIAHHEYNPRPGVIINHPKGKDVYQGVPKDYTGKDVNSDNFYAVILGNKSAVNGGSGKVLNTGPNDNIFIFYTDHGSPGFLGMPSSGDGVYANDLIRVLNKKHSSKSYKTLVFYVEACESASLFDGLLPNDMNMYVVTASNATEDSWAWYCPGDAESPPKGYDTCLGDLFSISWMEDMELHSTKGETFREQYKTVRRRTKNHNYHPGSHVMRFGNVSLSDAHLSSFMGNSAINDAQAIENYEPLKSVNQKDTVLVYLLSKIGNAPIGSLRRTEAHKLLVDTLSERTNIDTSMAMIGEILFGSGNGSGILEVVRPGGQPLVDDWDCLKNMVKIFETNCGMLSEYGRRHIRSIANICNAGIREKQMADASTKVCNKTSSIS